MKNRAIEFWRFIFTIIVCLLHYEVNYFGDGSQPYFECGYLGVEFFCILSGFLIMMYVEKTEEGSPTLLAMNYTKNRVKKFYPYLLTSWFILLTNMVISNRNIQIYWSEGKKHFWEYVLLNSTGITWDILNGPTWYISSLLIVGYFVFWLLKYKKELFTGFIAPFIVFLVYSYYALSGKGIDVHLMYARISMGAGNRVAAGLCLGCLTFYIYKNKIIEIKNRWILNLVEVFTIVSIFFTLIRNVHSSDNLQVLFYFPILILLSFRQETIVSKILNNQCGIISSLLGKISLPLYLNQVFCIGFSLKYLRNESYKVSLINYILFSIMFAVFVQKLLESIMQKINSYYIKLS